MSRLMGDNPDVDKAMQAFRLLVEAGGDLDQMVSSAAAKLVREERPQDVAEKLILLMVALSLNGPIQPQLEAVLALGGKRDKDVPA